MSHSELCPVITCRYSILSLLCWGTKYPWLFVWAGVLCGGGNALLWGPMSVLEIVLSTVNMIVNKRNRGLALLVMLVILRSEQTITV